MTPTPDTRTVSVEQLQRWHDFMLSVHRGEWSSRLDRDDLTDEIESLIAQEAAPASVSPPRVTKGMVADMGASLDDLEAVNKRLKELSTRYGLDDAAPAQAEQGQQAEFQIEGADGFTFASASGPRADAWREIQHYAAQYADEGPITIYEVTRRAILSQQEGGKG